MQKCPVTSVVVHHGPLPGRGYSVVVVVSVGDDHSDLWLLVQGLGLRTKLAPLQYQLNGCLQIQQAQENRGGGNIIIFLTFKLCPARTNQWI